MLMALVMRAKIPKTVMATPSTQNPQALTWSQSYKTCFGFVMRLNKLECLYLASLSSLI
jgi:hypothetical protein